jgi:hypothetical protein
VVVTPEGPVIIEGNHTWGILMMQTVGGGYLVPEVEAALKRLGVPVDTSRLPPVRIGSGLASLRAILSPTDQP